MRRVLKFFLSCGVLSLGLTTTGCTTRYQPPAAGEIATLTAISPVWLVSVDGQRIPGIGFTGERRVSVSPGEHFIEVKYSETMHMRVGHWDRVYVEVLSDSKVELKFRAQAGRSYFIQAGRSEMKWRPFVSESREPVFQEIENP